MIIDPREIHHQSMETQRHLSMEPPKHGNNKAWKHQSIETPKHIIPELERERDRRGPEQISPEAYITKSVHHQGKREKPNQSNTKEAEQRDQTIVTPKHENNETKLEQHQSTRTKRPNQSSTKEAEQ